MTKVAPIATVQTPANFHAEQIEKEAAQILAEAKQSRVVDLQDPESIRLFVVSRVRPLRAKIASDFDPIIHQANKHHRTLLALKRRYDDPLAVLERKLKGCIDALTLAAQATTKLLQQAQKSEGLPAPMLVPEKQRGVTVTVKPEYRIVDVDKIKPEYMKLVPDVEKIGLTVKKYGEEAATVVGGIEVTMKRTVALKNET